MSAVEHVVVIGGGAAGCAAAYELGKAGVRVTLVEREGVGGQASGWSAGGLNPLQGIQELLDTYELVRAHYNASLALAGVIVNRWERTVEHRSSTAEIERYFGPDLPWQPYVPKRTALQDSARQGIPVHRLPGTVARELADAFEQLAARMGALRAAG